VASPRQQTLWEKNREGLEMFERTVKSPVHPMPTFRIEFDPRRRDWLLRAHPLINHADLRFGNDSREGGLLGLLGAIRMVLFKAQRSGGTLEIEFSNEVSVLHFRAQHAPDLAQLNGGGGWLAD
jgi:hypothetical protein